jgi:phospholipid/cholesterol/gamma-HCH transport system ATP-binding protein
MKSTPVETGLNPPVIEFKNVSLSFAETPALKNVSFQLSQGQMIVITGASLSGKSVLLHLAIGLLMADEGEILIQGRAIENLSERALLELRSASMGMTFQEDTLFSSLTVHENAAYRLTEHNWSEEETDRAVREILRFVGLENDVEKLPEELSIGMRRRLEIARAMIGWPPIMLFDEPTSGLDPITDRQVLNLIIRALQKISSLYVTKELHEIPYLASHLALTDQAGEVSICKADLLPAGRLQILVLDQGQIAFLGDAREFADSALPAVTRLTHPGSGSQRTGPLVAV